jgi:hypothetical protein
VRWLRNVGRFCYDFVVGDDWRIAAGTVGALLLTWVLANSGVNAWWLVPVVFVVVLPGTVWHAVRHRR